MEKPDKMEEQRRPKVWRQSGRDHPEQYPTERESLFDMWESEQNVDPIPVEDVKLEQREERRKVDTKRESSSEEKYEQ